MNNFIYLLYLIRYYEFEYNTMNYFHLCYGNILNKGVKCISDTYYKYGDE